MNREALEALSQALVESKTLQIKTSPPRSWRGIDKTDALSILRLAYISDFICSAVIMCVRVKPAIMPTPPLPPPALPRTMSLSLLDDLMRVLRHRAADFCVRDALIERIENDVRTAAYRMCRVQDDSPVPPAPSLADLASAQPSKTLTEADVRRIIAEEIPKHIIVTCK